MRGIYNRDPEEEKRESGWHFIVFGSLNFFFLSSAQLFHLLLHRLASQRLWAASLSFPLNPFTPSRTPHWLGLSYWWVTGGRNESLKHLVAALENKMEPDPEEKEGTRDRLMRPFAYARGLGSLIYRRDIITSLHKFIAKHGYLRHRPSPPSWRSCWQSHSIWIKCSTYWWLHDHLFVRRYSGASTATAGGTTATMPSISGRDKSWSNNLRTPN